MAKKPTRTSPSTERVSLSFSAINGIFLIAAFAAIAFGYMLLAKGSNVAAPLLIVLGYVVLLPLAIIL